MFPRHAFPLFFAMAGLSFAAEPLPAPALLPVRPLLPDALTLENGKRVQTREQWASERAPELKRLFQEYEYGIFPPKPAGFEARVVRVDAQAFGGKATLKEIAVHCTKPDALVHLMLVVPNARAGKPVPCFLGMNFNGNYALVADPLLGMPASWVAPAEPAATPVVRGKEIEAWSIEKSIERGYAVAAFYNGDVVPDKAAAAKERLKDFVPEGQPADSPSAPATIGAWAWGFSRMIDYLVTDADVDPARIAVVGHSRNGKTALFAAAMDSRIALAIPSQAGCGGTAPCRLAPELAVLGKNGRPGAETLAVINGNFPHWFAGNFKAFNEAVEKLPFDQHALIALCAPRPVLISTATEDLWSNPPGQLEMLRAADGVYRLVSGEGADLGAAPEVGRLQNNRLGYFQRAGKHSMNAEDWSAWLDYADKWLK